MIAPLSSIVFPTRAVDIARVVIGGWRWRSGAWRTGDVRRLGGEHSQIFWQGLGIGWLKEVKSGIDAEGRRLFRVSHG
jgi:hypothetical protein